MLSEPLTVNRFETPGSPNTVKLPYPPPVLTVTPGADNAYAVMSFPGAGRFSNCALSNVVAMLALSVCIMETCPSTVTVSVCFGNPEHGI